MARENWKEITTTLKVDLNKIKDVDERVKFFKQAVVDTREQIVKQIDSFLLEEQVSYEKTRQ